MKSQAALATPATLPSGWRIVPRQGGIAICHLQVFPIMSGPQRSMLELFRYLDRDRFDLHVVCKETGPLTDELERLGITWHAVPELDRPIGLRRDWRAYRRLRQLFRDHQFALVHTHSSKPGVLGRLAARSAGVPCVVHHVRAFAFHEHTRPMKRWAYSQIESRLARHCDRMLFVNDEERAYAVASGWLPAEKALTIFNGADTQALHPRLRQPNRARLRAEWRVSDKEVVLLYVGRLEYPKQPLLLADIAAELKRKRCQTAWRLVIAGSGPDEAALATRLRALGVNDRVTMLGWQTRPLDLYAAADVTLLPSLAEGLPRALIEAHAAGVPSVASNAKGCREVIVDGRTGRLCVPSAASSYAEALAELIDQPNIRLAMGMAARRRAERYFDSEVNNRRIVAVYDELLEQAGLSKRGESRQSPTPARRAA